MKKIFFISIAIILFLLQTVKLSRVEALDDLIAHYQFNSNGNLNSGTIISDSSGTGNNAVLKGNGAYINENKLFLPGGAQNSSAAYIELPKGMFDNKENLTISVWLKNETGSADYCAMYFGTTESVPTGYWLLNPSNRSGYFKSVLTNSVNKEAPWSTETKVSTTTTSNGWLLYTTVIGENYIKGYLNGVLVSEDVKTRSVSSFGSNLVSYIGRSSYNDIFYKGGVMDVRVYNRTLSNDEINDLYETTAPPEVVKQANLNYSGSDKKEAYLFAYFKGESLANGEQIYYATSEDGLNWNAVNNGDPVITSVLGEKGLRDPFIIRSPEGDKFFLIATDLKIYNGNGWTAAQTNGSKSIMVWESNDLVNWSEQRMCPVAPQNAGCTWAPEAFWNSTTQEYMVFWSSKIPTGDNIHRVYYSTTKDFKTFSEAKVWIQLNNTSNSPISVIDASVTKIGDTYYRFIKNESNQPHLNGMPSGKYTILQKSNSLLGGWQEIPSNINSITGVEGATCFKFNNEEKWCLLLDNYGSGGYYPLVTSDLSSGSFTKLNNSQYSFPSTVRHGTVIPITRDEYIDVLKKYDKAKVIISNSTLLKQTIVDLKGDINGVGKLDIKDVVILKKYMISSYELTNEQIKISDVNEDGRVDLFDSVLILNMVLK